MDAVSSPQSVPSLSYLILLGILERFSFYSVRGILILYVTQMMWVHPEEAFEIAGLFSSLPFFVSIAVGYVNDRTQYLREMVVGGFCATLCGILLLLFHERACLLMALALMSMGSGAVKGTLPTLLAQLTSHGRSELFTSLYIANNIGALLGTGVCGIIGEVFGWSWCFMIAGCLLLVGILVIGFYEWGRSAKFIRQLGRVFLFLLPTSALMWWLFSHREFTFSIIVGGLCLAVAVGGYIQLQAKKVGEFAYLFLLLGLYIAFSILYEQGGLSMVLLTEHLADRRLPEIFHSWLGLREIPVTAFLNIDPIANIGIGLFLIFLYKRMPRVDTRSSYFYKFCLGLGFALLNFVLLSQISISAMGLNPLLIMGFYIIFVCGEQMIYPVILVATADLSPVRHRSFFFSFSMAAGAVGTLLAAKVAQWTLPPEHASLPEALSVYQHHGQQAVYILIGILGTLIFSKVIVSRMRGVH